MSSINTLRRPSAPHLHRSKLARAPHLDSSNPTKEGFLKRNIVPIAGLALTAFLLGACAGGDPNAIPAVQKIDWLNAAIERNPYNYPGSAAAMAGTVTAVTRMLVTGKKHMMDALDPGKTKYNVADGLWDTLIDTAAASGTMASAMGTGVLLAQMGISDEVLPLVRSQLPILGGVVIGLNSLTLGTYIKDVFDLFRLPTPTP